MPDENNWEPLGSAVERVLHKIAGPRTASPRAELRPNVGRYLWAREVKSLVSVYEQVGKMREQQNAV